MAIEVVMPKFGLTMQEGTIQQWFKAEGEKVTLGEPLFELETEKVLYEVEAPASGTVAKLLYPPEATVACAAVVAVIAVDGEDAAGVAAQYATGIPAAAERAHAAAQLVVPPSGGRAPQGQAGPAAPVTPAARKLAKEHGVDLATVRGTGPGGRITREDVEAAVARGAAAPAVATAAGSPLRGMRKSIAEHMFKSLQSTAQLTITTEADVTATVARYERWKCEFALTYTDLLIEAVAKALREHRRLNVTAADGMVQQHETINVGVAVALDEGLIVPVIRTADQKPLRQIAEESRALAKRARDGSLGVDEVAGGTFTITNLGMYGVDAFTPILHTPQVAILGVGRIQEKPAVHEGQLAVRHMMVLSLTFDHRIVDGAPAAAFLRSVVGHLQAGLYWYDSE